MILPRLHHCGNILSMVILLLPVRFLPTAVAQLPVHGVYMAAPLVMSSRYLTAPVQHRYSNCWVLLTNPVPFLPWLFQPMVHLSRPAAKLFMPVKWGMEGRFMRYGLVFHCPPMSALKG